jgi:hypothetical protein
VVAPAAPEVVGEPLELLAIQRAASAGGYGVSYRAAERAVDLRLEFAAVGSG